MYITGKEQVRGIDEIEDLGVEMNQWWNHWPRDSDILPRLVDIAVSRFDYHFLFFLIAKGHVFPFSLKPG